MEDAASQHIPVGLRKSRLSLLKEQLSIVTLFSQVVHVDLHGFKSLDCEELGAILWRIKWIRFRVYNKIFRHSHQLQHIVTQGLQSSVSPDHHHSVLLSQLPIRVLGYRPDRTIN